MHGKEGSFELIASNKMIYSILYIVVGIILWILNNEFGKVNFDDRDNIRPAASNV